MNDEQLKKLKDLSAALENGGYRPDRYDANPFSLANKELMNMRDLTESSIKEYTEIMEQDKKESGPQPGPKAAPRSLNGRFIVESYKEDRGLKTTVQNGFAMVQQKVSVKGLKLLTDVQNASGQYIAYKGDIVYIRESSLQSQPWAKATFTSDAIEGEFIIVEQSHVEFVDKQ